MNRYREVFRALYRTRKCVVAMVNTRRLGSTVLVMVVLGWMPAARPSAVLAFTSGKVPQAGSGCAASLTLLLTPGPGTVPDMDRPAADIPRTPLVMHLPLYPEAVPSTYAMPLNGGMHIPALYRKVAVAEYAVAVPLQIVQTWYAAALSRCGFRQYGFLSRQRQGGITYAGGDFVNASGVNLQLTYRVVSRHLTAIRYVLQALDLPPRPKATYLHGPFVRVNVTVHMYSAVPTGNHFWRFTITWPATISRLVHSINSLKYVYPGPGCCGGVVVSSETATLSFVRPDRGTRLVALSSILDTVTIGRAGTLSEAVRVLPTVNAIAQRRCGMTSACDGTM